MEAKQPDPKHWDVFCRIVDNFGDIGVSWRLSRQLAHEHGITVRLFTDECKVAAKLIPGFEENTLSQVIEGIEILHWAQADFAEAAAVVLETFSCELPAAYLEKMVSAHSVWVNVEYLSAESWVDDFHAKPSQLPALNLTKYFFFPGFTEHTGGLLRERDLIVDRDAFNNDAVQQHDFWQRIGVKYSTGLDISLFGYPQANVKDLLKALLQHPANVNLYVPIGSILEALKPLYPHHDFAVGSGLHIGNLTLHILPFLSQSDYDHLLWACDINFVRGEDSWIRAIWAGKPFIWQPYIQSGNTHLQKLDAFLDIYAQEVNPALKACLQNAHYAWSAATQDVESTQCWQDFLTVLPLLKQHAEMRSQAFAAQTDLASKLVIFSEKIEQNQV